MVNDWDATTYDRIADPQERWGAVVLERLRLDGDERILDAGCGSGRVTERLLERLPQGGVVALDVSPGMLAEARRRLSPSAERVEFVEADLAKPLPIRGRVDGVLSTAVLHWIPDHAAVFRNLAAVMAPSAQLVVQCGGVGNLDSVRLAQDELGIARSHKEYETPEATRPRLEAAGFTDIQVWLSQAPTPFETTEQLEMFLATVVLRVEVTAMEDGERRRAVRAVAERVPGRTLDYVRLNILARAG